MHFARDTQKETMSLLSDFAAAAAAQAFPVIGEESVVIGSTTLQCVLSEMDHGKDFSSGGYEVTRRMSAVCRSADMPVGAILKKLATARGISFRVESVKSGATFTTIELLQAEKA